MSSENRTSFLRKFRRSLIGAGVLLGADIVVYGSFLLSIFVVPIWLLAAIVRAIVRRGDWRASVWRVVIPLITLVIVLSNAWLQSRVAQAHAQEIIEASKQYQATHGVYPKTLDELVSRYLGSVPRAKYALLGEFLYWECGDRLVTTCVRSGADKGQHILMWVSTPPFGRPYYNFEQARWGYLD
jgi:hypothetical protein